MPEGPLPRTSNLGHTPSPEMIALTKDRLGNAVNCYVHDFNSGLGKERSESYDIVLSALAIHYISQLEHLFLDIARVLRNDGEFVFSTHHPLMEFQLSESGDYFKTEKITQHWETVGTPIEVTFFRRPLEALFQTIESAGLCVTRLSEGRPSDKLAVKSPEDYERLSKAPNFIFIKCRKCK